MTENKRFRMETIGDIMLPFIVDNSTAKKKSDTTTTYHTYETHRKEKCLELVDLLNDLSEENEQSKSIIDKLTLDNTKMKKVLNTTKKENEHIKNTIQEAYNNERTKLGQSVLKQLLETIQWPKPNS